MSTPQTVKVFLSYSHRDERLKEDLDAHLSALKRSGIIETWHDRKIGLGNEWKREIDNRMPSADVILLLISADFLASDFGYLGETRLALERRTRGEAIVIPVILREVDFRGLPIESLEMLPKGAVPVTSKKWASEDEALRNVAEGIRDAVDRFREQRSFFREDEPRSVLKLESRYLDAAVAGQIPLDTIREVVALVRLGGSRGLTCILSETRSPASVYPNQTKLLAPLAKRTHCPPKSVLQTIPRARRRRPSGRLHTADPAARMIRGLTPVSQAKRVDTVVCPPTPYPTSELEPAVARSSARHNWLTLW